MKTHQDSPAAQVQNLTNIAEILEGVETLYVYPQHQIKLVEGMLQQTRSGPNWEGGVVTMATCKHFLRTYSSIEEKKVALCGITNTLKGERYLLYIGVIDKAFESNYDLGTHLLHNKPGAYKAKLMKNNRLGDIVEPSLEGMSMVYTEDRYTTFDFEEPCADHCRKQEQYSDGSDKWERDIEYKTRSGKRPQCLILGPVTVHTEPLLEYTEKFTRSGRVYRGEEIQAFVEGLEEAL